MTYDKKVLDKAQEIVDNCQGKFDSFCNARCPMHTDVLGYVNLVGENKLGEAVKKIREKLFLPKTLGRICAHPCETACRREKEFGQAISIAALKRYAADKADDESLWDLTKKSASGKKVAVIGAGPAGAQAAIDLARDGHAVTVYEKLQVVGGMMRVGIPEYRLPRNIIDFEYSYLEKLGVQFKMGVEIGRDITFEELTKTYDAVIAANGAHKGFVPPVNGAEAEGVTNAAAFLKSVSLGESTNAGKTVVVIGGGDVAMDCARSALRVGAEKVTLVSLEQEAEMPASNHEKHGALDEGVIFQCGWGSDEITSADNRVSGLKLKKCTAVFNAEGKFSPTYSDETTVLECDTVIFATGQMVEDVTNGAIQSGGGGRYVSDKQTLATSIENVFVAGDCAGATIVIEAMAYGRKAAISANRFLAGEDLTKDRDFSEELGYDSKLDIPLPEGTQDLPRKQTKMLDPKERVKSFVECDLGFDDVTAIEEGKRCLKCECKKCMTECIMLNDFTSYPAELFKKFLADGNMEPLVAYSCNMCDQCTIACPQDFKFAEIFGGIRKDMVKANNGESPMAGHKAIKMHQKLGFSKFFTVIAKGGKK
ncbi:MAG: FAD-dependent oxidoreductase [Defluviitaleaceae bacterium]|nr:FAD-dependent oxidoreductase [Defluviitaleaceae bacterium]